MCILKLSFWNLPTKPILLLCVQEVLAPLFKIGQDFLVMQYDLASKRKFVSKIRKIKEKLTLLKLWYCFASRALGAGGGGGFHPQFLLNCIKRSEILQYKNNRFDQSAGLIIVKIGLSIIGILHIYYVRIVKFGELIDIRQSIRGQCARRN